MSGGIHATPEISAISDCLEFTPGMLFENTFRIGSI
jgi:hypothetical protein